MALTTLKIRSLRALSNGKALKKSDGHGLFILVHPTGTKTWKFSYRSGGKQKTVTLGTFPEIGLAVAREMRAKLRSAQQTGQDTNEALVLIKNGGVEQTPSLNFYLADVIEHEQQRALTATTMSKKRWLRDAIPQEIREKDVSRITRADLAELIRSVVKKGHYDKARRLARLLVKTCDRAVLDGKIVVNAAERLFELVPTRAARHHPAIVDPAELSQFLLKTHFCGGSPSVNLSLRLAPHVFLRPGEMRAGRWSEIDWDNSEWIIPSERMKMSRDHIVPLSSFVIDLLHQHRSENAVGDLIFPSERSADIYISENTMNQALWRLGYKGIMTAHGYRTTASTLLNEMGWNWDWIEYQLSHSQSNAVRDAYNRAKYLEGRRKMMLRWSEYLVELEKYALEAAPNLPEMLQYGPMAMAGQTLPTDGAPRS